ncbi:MAG: GCN5-related N-acetyltransferase [Anaerolineales bacterium]|nr:GCN5-related N-acetyltransferase [Anaerolineales bacterium]
MTSTQIETFSAEHLAGAAAVLSARHTDHLAQSPLLAPGDARAALKGFWDKKGRSGAVAIRDGRVVGFVLAEIMAHPLFGDCAWVAHPGHAADDGELLRDLYSAAAEVWVESGADRHYVLVPAHARALEAWYRLGFGHMHVEALRSLPIEEKVIPEGVTLRLGRRDDLETAEAIDLEIFRLQARSPSFSRLPLNRGARRDEWLEMDLDEDGLRYLVAERDGRPVGHTLIYRPEAILGYPAGVAYLASTVVVEDSRGAGIGSALVAEVLRLAKEAGYGSVVTNWRMTNLSASRFWTAQGFQPIYHRMHRALGSG